jgi:murein DD-endopeptidase MepM/ murein hydrolase activator NlpD
MCHSVNCFQRLLVTPGVAPKYRQQAGPSGFDGVRHAKSTPKRCFTKPISEFGWFSTGFYRESRSRSPLWNALHMWRNRRFYALLAVPAALLVLFAPKPVSASAADVWKPPLTHPRLVREFRQPTADWSSGHRGVDYQVSDSTTVLAPHRGVVSFVGWVVNRPVISIHHENGMITAFEPVCSTLTKGQSVETGQELGNTCFGTDYVSHCLPAHCLHFSLRSIAGYLSPLMMLGQLSPSRLKPWGGLRCSPASNAQC